MEGVGAENVLAQAVLDAVAQGELGQVVVDGDADLQGHPGAGAVHLGRAAGLQHMDQFLDVLEPLVLLETALRRAEADSGAKLLGDIQSLDVVSFLSWRYRDPEKQLAARVGASPAHCYYGPVGGEGPIRYLHEAALRIQRGDAVRAKLAALGLTETDVADAVRWARSDTAPPAAAEPAARYATRGSRPGKPIARKKPARRA